MQPQHDAYCDEQHLPRQQCNDALAPADLQAATPTESEPVEAAEPIIEPAPDEESVSSAIRKGVATAGALEPAAYASRETAPVDTVERASGGGMRRVAMVAVAIAVVLVTARGVRGRRGERV